MEEDTSIRQLMQRVLTPGELALCQGMSTDQQITFMEEYIASLQESI